MVKILIFVKTSVFILFINMHFYNTFLKRIMKVHVFFLEFH
jgi:uncharacterized membrane protein